MRRWGELKRLRGMSLPSETATPRSIRLGHDMAFRLIGRRKRERENAHNPGETALIRKQRVDGNPVGLTRATANSARRADVLSHFLVEVVIASYH